MIGAIAGLTQVYLTLALVLAFFANIGVYVFSGDEYRACRRTPDIQMKIDELSGEEVQYWPFTEEFRLCNNDDVCAEL